MVSMMKKTSPLRSLTFLMYCVDTVGSKSLGISGYGNQFGGNVSSLLGLRIWRWRGDVWSLFGLGIWQIMRRECLIIIGPQGESMFVVIIGPQAMEMERGGLVILGLRTNGKDENAGGCGGRGGGEEEEVGGSSCRGP